MLIASLAAVALLAPPTAPPLLSTTLDPQTALPHWPATLERVSQGPAGAVYIEPASIKWAGDVGRG